jgi:nitronate monooxygenase
MPTLTTSITRALGIRLPIIQAPMVGGANGPEMVAAVSNAGGLGSFAAAALAPDAIGAGAQRVRELTRQPFCINMFVLATPSPDAGAVQRGLDLLAPFRAELGLPPGQALGRYCEPFEEQFEALLEAAPALASFTFDVLSAAQVERLHARGCLVSGTATNLAEARAWADAGADFICAQGAEAGGHRGTFIGNYQDSLIGTIALVPQMVDAVRVPVIAAGGIMDGRGIAAALTLGAGAAQLGTAFLSCSEASAHPGWQRLLRESDATSTALTLAFSGRMARGINNDFMRRMAGHQHEVPAYPVQNALTGEIRAAAAKAGRTEYLSLWAGQGLGMSRGLPAATLMAQLEAETEGALGMA